MQVTQTAFLEALDRLLEHAELHGEVYPGAVDDLRTIRAGQAILTDANRNDDGGTPELVTGEPVDESPIVGDIGAATTDAPPVSQLDGPAPTDPNDR